MRSWLSAGLVVLMAAGSGCKSETGKAVADGAAGAKENGKAAASEGDGAEAGAASPVDAEGKSKATATAKSEGKDSDGEAKAKPSGGLSGAVKKAVADAASIKGLELIPDRAILLAGVDVAALVTLPVWPRLRDSLGTRQKDQMKAAAGCGVDVDKWRTFVIGTEPVTRGMAMVVTVEGIGKKETLRCLSGVLGFTLTADGKRMSDHTGGGVVLDDDSIAFASTAWMDLLDARIEGKGTAAAAGPLRAALSRTDRSKTLWVAGTLPEVQGELVAAALGTKIHDVAGWADLRDGLDVQISIAVPDGKETLQQLQLKWLGAKMLAESRAVPKGVADSVELTEKDDVVTVALSATPEETRTLTDSVRTMMGI